MTKDYSEELKELIEKYKHNGFRYAKPLDFLLERINELKRILKKN